MNDKNKLGATIKELRINMKLSQAQLAELIGKTTGIIGQFERGERYPNYETIYKIIVFFGADANIFFSREKTQYSMESILMLNLFSQMKEADRKAVISFHKNSPQLLNFMGINHIVCRDENKLGIVIKELRENMNISQAQLAEVISKSTSTVSQFERGEVFPRYKTLCKIIRFFDVDANLFFPSEKTQHSMETVLMLLLNSFSQMKDNEKRTIVNFHQNLTRLLNFVANNQMVNHEEGELT